MPRPAAAKCPRPSCDVERVHREWKDTPAVRHVSVRRDRLFESHQPHPDSDEKVSIRFCIKDAVHNQYVLIPLLRRMAHDEMHPLPSLKSLITQIKIYRNKMSLVCQKDKIKLDAWTCKSMLSFIKMKTHKNLGSADRDFLKLQRILDPEIQPRHRHGVPSEASDDADEDGLELPMGEDGHTLGPEDLVVFNSDDQESESEDDSWFDQMIEKNLNGFPDSLEDSQPATDSQVELPTDSQLPMDSQVLQFHEDVDWLGAPTSPPKDVDQEVVRPVARPLKISEEKLLANYGDDQKTPEKPSSMDPVVVADSPASVPATPVDSKANKAQRIAFLKAQLAALEDDSDRTSVDVCAKKEVVPAESSTDKKQVLTRRQQLRVAAEEKADKLAEKEGKKQPAPKAGGRGRGRGRGRGKAKVVDPETVPEPHGEVSSPTKKSVDSDMEVDEQKVSQKRPMHTPERRKLFKDDDDMVVTPAKATDGSVPSPPVKQDRKRPKRAAVKSKAKEPKARRSTENPKFPAKELAKTSQHEKKGDKNGKDTDKEGGKEGDQEGDKEIKPVRPPSQKLQKWAHEHLVEAKQDSSAWFFVIKLFEGTKVAERSCDTKMMTHFSFSMYWRTRRVGLLQKQVGGGSKHLMSYGGGHCQHIGIPYMACRLVVDYMGGDKGTKCKEAESDEVTAFKDALKDLVTAVSIVHSLGKVLEDFEQ